MMMSKRISTILVCIIITLLSSHYTYAVGALEWHVEIGDSNTFIYTEVYDSRSIDSDQITLYEHNGDERIEIIVTKGTLVSYTITQLLPFSETIYGIRTFNNNISIREELILGVVRKTINNRTHWEAYSADDPRYSLYQDTLIETEEWLVSLSVEAISYFQKEITIWDLRTGWMVSSSIVAYNEGVTYYEVSLELLEGEKYSIFNLQSNYIFGSLLLVCITLFYFISKSYQQKLIKKK